LSTSSVTSTPSGRPLALKVNTPSTLPVWRPPPPVGVGRARHPPQPHTIDWVWHPGRLEDASSHVYC
jgi:hypothetical protein